MFSHDDKVWPHAPRYHTDADAEIVHYYLTRYAIRKKENEQTAGNLARATYSA